MECISKIFVYGLCYADVSKMSRPQIQFLVGWKIVESVNVNRSLADGSIPVRRNSHRAAWTILSTIEKKWFQIIFFQRLLQTDLGTCQVSHRKKNCNFANSWADWHMRDDSANYNLRQSNVKRFSLALIINLLYPSCLLLSNRNIFLFGQIGFPLLTALITP